MTNCHQSSVRLGSTVIDMSGLADIRVGEVRRGATRLGPFAAAAGAALLLVAVPPGSHHSGQAAAGARARFRISSPSAPGESQGNGAAAPPTAAQDLNATPAAALPASTAGPAPALAAYTPLPSADSGAAAGSSAPGAGDESPSAGQTFETRLSVTGKAWASREAGTPLATTDVPEGTLPVGNRLGQLDKASFVRLTGTATTLTLVDDAGGDRSLAGAGAVQACPIKGQWSDAAAMSFDQAPTYDTATCVSATHSDNRTWSFDLSGFAERAGGHGFALVPAADAPVDFQVSFKVS